MATPLLCPGCGKPLSKNPKHAELVWECQSELGCKEIWGILKMPGADHFLKKKKKGV